MNSSTSPRPAGRTFRAIGVVYRMLPAPIRNSGKFAHYASVAVSKFMPKRRIIVNTPGGEMCIWGPHPGDLQRAWGVWELDLQSFLKTNLRSGQVFVDVGAHRGTYTVMASHLVGDHGRVIAIEPYDDHFECLEQTVKRARYKNITVFKSACGERDGEICFSSQERRIAESPDLVRMISLDTNVKRADFIKIDTDGNEIDVLRGARRLISEGSQVIVEFSDFPYQSIDLLWKEASSLLADMSYKPWLIHKDGSVVAVTGGVEQIRDRHVLFKRDKSELL